MLVPLRQRRLPLCSLRQMSESLLVIRDLLSRRLLVFQCQVHVMGPIRQCRLRHTLDDFAPGLEFCRLLLGRRYLQIQYLKKFQTQDFYLDLNLWLNKADREFQHGLNPRDQLSPLLKPGEMACRVCNLRQSRNPKYRGEHQSAPHLLGHALQP